MNKRQGNSPARFFKTGYSTGSQIISLVYGSCKSISGEKSRDPGNRAQVAELVDAVRREDGCIVQFLFPDTDPAQLVTDSSYLCFSAYHNDDALLAGDTIKRCFTCRGFSFGKNRGAPGGSSCPD